MKKICYQWELRGSFCILCTDWELLHQTPLCEISLLFSLVLGPGWEYPVPKSQWSLFSVPLLLKKPNFYRSTHISKFKDSFWMLFHPEPIMPTTQSKENICVQCGSFYKTSLEPPLKNVIWSCLAFWCSWRAWGGLEGLLFLIKGYTRCHLSPQSCPGAAVKHFCTRPFPLNALNYSVPNPSH